MPEITEEEIRLLTRRWVRLQDEADAYSDGMGSARTQEEATAARVMLELAKRARRRWSDDDQANSDAAWAIELDEKGIG